MAFMVLEIFLVMALISITSTFDPFEGFLQQGRPCFPEINSNGCNTQLSQVFTPTYKGVNINAINTQLWLFTTTNPESAEPLHKCGGKLPDRTTFDPSVDTIFITHGWLDGVCRSAWIREFKDQLFIRGKYNVITVNWNWGNTIDPVGAAFNAIVVGEQVAFVIQNIMEQTGMKNGDKFHLIGHSYGAYVISSAANHLYSKDPALKPRRISLLDPAIAPLRGDNPYLLIVAEHTKFMDVIHGDGGTCAPVNFGFFTPVGHVDFYPNGGAFQLSCYSYAATAFEIGDLLFAVTSIVYPSLCSHLHAIQYFKVSINHPQGLFIGAECHGYEDFLLGCPRCCKKDFSKCAVMGMDAEKYFQHSGEPRRNRTYYMNLGLECPYNEDYEFSIYRDC